MSQVVFGAATEVAWKEGWWNILKILNNLTALGISAPTRYTHLKHCFIHCTNLRTLKLTFTKDSPIAALRHLGKYGQGLLPTLQVLQINLPSKLGSFYTDNLIDIATHLREVVSHRKGAGNPIEKMGILYSDLEDITETFSWFPDNVTVFKWGDVCEDIFLEASEINLEKEWDAW